MDTMSRNKMMKKNSEPVDEWLTKEGYYRKMSPKDSTCLFRVISEHIYLTQHDHIKVRNECVSYMRENPSIIQKSVSISVNDYLDQMACFTQWGGDNEIKAMSLLYKIDFIVFSAQKFTRTPVTKNGFEKFILLCHSPQKQYDAVYSLEYISNAAFCQSIVYQTLYKNVFNIIDIDNTVHEMLHERSQDYRHDKFFLKGNMEIRDQLKMEFYNKIDDGSDEIDENRNSGTSAPFPYRVAKALDPHIFRNTDLDVYQELKKEVKFAGWARFTNDFQIGAKCLVQLDKVDNADKENNNIVSNSESDSIGDSKLPNKNLEKKKEDAVFYNGHIQEMTKNEGPVVVYIEELGERKTVPYAALKPLSARKAKLNPNWNNNIPRKSITSDQNQKFKKPWGCSRRPKELMPNMNMSNFDRAGNGIRKDVNESKDWSETSHKNDPIMSPDKYKSQNYNNQNYVDANVSMNIVPVELTQQQMSEISHCRNPEEEVKKPVFEQTDINRNNVVMSNSHYVHGNNGNANYQSKPATFTNPENAPIVPTVQPINLSVTKSVDINGNDLPYSEPCTLRFFYNLGLEYFHANQMWNYPPNDQMIAPAYFTSQNPPPFTGPGNFLVLQNGTNNEELENAAEQNRPKLQNMRRRDEVVDRNRNNPQKGNVPRNNERYNKPMQGFQAQGHDPQKMRDFNKNASHNNSERKDQNINKDVQRNNRNALGSRFRKNDGRNGNNNNQVHPQKQDHHHQTQTRYNSFNNNNNNNNNNNLKPSTETCQLAEVEQSSAGQQQQQQQFSNPATLYPMPYNQPPMYNQVAMCGSESETFGGFYQPQANYYPFVYQAPSNGDPNLNVDECGGYQVYSPYVYQQAPAVFGVPDNWFPVAGPPPAFVPYAPIVPPNTPNNSQAPAV